MRVLLAFGLLLLVGCHPQTIPSDAIALDDSDTLLGTGDVIDIRVYGEESLSNTYQIGHDGAIDFPMLGPIRIAGLAPNEATQMIAKELRGRHFFVDPQVSIFVKEINSKRVRIIGAVSKPGTLTIRDGLTVLEAITNAGGFTPIASRNGTMLIRTVKGKTVRYRIRVDDITNGKSKDIPVTADDIIFVPNRAF